MTGIAVRVTIAFESRMTMSEAEEKNDKRPNEDAIPTASVTGE
ncbi:MAG: hypothetical protein ACYS6W_11645 [Planctomycetota bacterium]